MTNGLFIVATAILSVELFSIGLVSRFLEKRSTWIGFLKVCIPFVSSSIILILGLLLGTIMGGLFSATRHWYAATLLFMLSIKLFYDAKKLTQAKRSINPLDTKGLLLLAAFAGINTFFVGISFGLAKLSFPISFFGILVLFLGTISGFFWGIFAKRLFLKQFDWVAAFVFLVIALFLVFKF
ncbi:MAG TPA: hypothetical protein DCQ26_00680 [Marinilabiliales bacterium]|jgi:putative Mn2+ efflux pump MntP|nr:MAG: hypothetical protein A2W95_00525 [Bacteroidetes bacterium GWA2_40_14]OFX58272.1 MAG: hypothetical protein A2W84_16410 [Bacteroidetes bacterium GWC2_40_13]OFX72563.1 MAG: hypothetical protein A2W96_04950 [Bacteroidetes bacterium GWD2_40_43]OFX94149.1 MAG: hypothetical protein A2W97_17660 [Bacteroidetes bacterium GWE2_40_63]OFY20301.1 MAG: hypothetical protein A2W88_12630 [Bacteroidetes bacterium GWF2_40_13]OFZ31837.1 MAG: hypothetical protein A2437_07845 [Bacteroidetes bacterium RIFOXYC